MRHGKSDVLIGHTQYFLSEFILPYDSFYSLAFWASAVAASEIDIFFIAALGTGVSFTAQGRSFANADASDEFYLCQRGLVDADVGFSKGSEK